MYKDLLKINGKEMLGTVMETTCSLKTHLMCCNGSKSHNSLG